MNGFNSQNFLTGDPLKDKATSLVEKTLAPSSDPWLLINTGTFLAKNLFSEIEHVCIHDYWQDHWECEKSEFPSYHGFPEETTFNSKKALIRADKSTDLTIYLILKAFEVSECTHVYLYGENKLGIKGLQKKISRDIHECTCLEMGNNSRILEIPRPKMALPATLPNKDISYPISANSALTLKSTAGVFGFGKVDAGTELLLEALPALDNQKILDLGCGAGSITLACLELGAELVSSTDMSALAIQCTSDNVKDEDRERLDLFPAFLGGKPAKGPYDIVITNPPFHLQKDIRMDIPAAWAKKCSQFLRYKGTLYLVANRFIPYAESLAPHFHFIETVLENKNFIVYRAVK